jgi:hypothetical protein
MKKEDLQNVLALHKKWLNDEEGGVSADLQGANLRDAKNIPDYVNATTIITPEGDLIGWKKLSGDKIAKIFIPKEAKRSNATGRKCRAEFADVLEIWEGDEQVKTGYASYNSGFIYEVGKGVTPDSFDDDRWNECSNGIHFFLTRYEAEHY